MSILSIRKAIGAVFALLLLLPSNAAIATGGQFGMEFAIDAPWRIEPFVNAQGQMEYGPIPITITFHDVNFADGSFPTGDKKVGVFFNAEVIERQQLADFTVRDTSTEIFPNQLREIERKIRISEPETEPQREVCVPAQSDCTALTRIAGSNEWHAMFWYTPTAPMTAGSKIYLQVSAFTKLGGKTREWRNYLVVHLGEKPLPRFSRNWLYGDLHYHSQMTDNEGESGYSYRNVIRTMGAMGLDFAFATDHASGGAQVASQGEARDLNPKRFQVAKDILYRADGANAMFGRDLAVNGFPRFRQSNLLPQLFMGEELDVMPEMNAAEQASGKLLFGDGQIYPWSTVSDCNGVNCLATFSMPAGTNASAAFGTCVATLMRAAVSPGSSPVELEAQARIKCIDLYKESIAVADQRFIILDKQGIPTVNIVKVPARQHIVYFPADNSTTGAGFIAGNTGEYGGATRRLVEVAAQISNQGVGFLAHPVDARSPGGEKGPDVVPYSRVQLEEAWRSPGILGLQLWNEDFTYKENVESGDILRVKTEFMSDFVASDNIKKHIYHLPWNIYLSPLAAAFNGGTIQDALSLYAKTPTLPWKWKTFEKQARSFDDKVLVEANGKPAMREIAKVTTNADNYHGTVAWDAFLRKGLDPVATLSLPWLPSGQPRKWFMAGGSDGHGDFNYRREGRPDTGGITTIEPLPWTDRPVSDAGIGKPRNLVLTDSPNGPPTGEVPNIRRTTNTQVIRALKLGQFSVTDGPALRIVADRNRDERADDADFQMGSTVNRYPGEHIPIIVQWESTPEFGRVKEIQLYVGNKAETISDVSDGPDRFVDYDPTGATPSPYGKYKKRQNFKFIIPVNQRNFAMSGQVIYYLSAKHFLALTDTSSNAAENGLYVRAFAKTVLRKETTASLQDCPTEFLHDSCGGRSAYTNPIWVASKPTCDGATSDAASVDGNNNGTPDICENLAVADPCRARPFNPAQGTVLTEVFFNTDTSTTIGQGRSRRFPDTRPDPRAPDSIEKSCRVIKLGDGILVRPTRDGAAPLVVQ